MDSRGRFLTDPQAMADLLRSHWSEVFAAKGIDEDKLDAWLQDDGRARGAEAPSHHELHSVRVKKRHIRMALKLSNNSAPGPDGIPYGALRALGDLAVETMHGAFQILASDLGPERMRQDYPDFNASILFFLPKKAVAETEAGTPAFEAGVSAL